MKARARLASIFWGCAIAGALRCGDVRADSDPSPRVDFHADRLELDPRLSRLALSGDVEVRVDRYWLASDHLVLTRGPLGVLVEGEGRVAFCPCPDPPITLGFRRALVAPPTDLLLTAPTLRAFGLPILWLPYLWIRSPTRVGLLPLKIALRGSDGLLVGSGVHVPFGEDALDVGLAGYAKGGFETDLRLSTPRSATRVVWDYLRQGYVDADSRGAVAVESSGAMAWSVDALRGNRALSGAPLLEDVAERDDRARVVAGYADGFTTVGLSLRADSNRGERIGALDAYGPGAHAGFGAALGAGVTADADVDAATLHEAQGPTTTLVVHRGEIRWGGHDGPVVFDVAARTRAALEAGEFDANGTVALGMESKAEVPFVKRWDAGASEFEHWIVPFVTATAGAIDSRAPAIVPPLSPDGGFYVASIGLRTTVGETSAHRFAVSASARVGLVGERGDAALPAFAWNAAGRWSFATLRNESIVAAGSEPAVVDVGEVRVGRASGPFVRGRVSESIGTMPLLARLLVAGWDAPWVPWFDAPGLSTGAGAGIPWTDFLATAADADYDVAARTLLGVSGSLTYRHRCGCLAVSLWGGHRLGRAGVDSWLTVDLMPRR